MKASPGRPSSPKLWPSWSAEKSHTNRHICEHRGLAPEIEQALIVGEGRPYLSAILVLNPEEWKRLAARYNLEVDAKESLENDKLQQHIIKIVRRRLKDFPGYAKVRRVILDSDQWSVDDGLLTPTLKVKRAKVLDRYGDAIEALYASGPVGR